MSGEHEVRTLADIQRVVTPDNVEGFIADFSAWLRLSLLDWRPADFTPVFRWRDDGDWGTLSSISVHISAKDRDVGC